MTIGIYGGTFSPIHYGHINAAYEFLHQCNLSHLYIVPAAIPPHKLIDVSDNPDIRYEMVKLAFKDNANITVSDYEIKSKGLSYTINTIRYFKELYKAEIIFLCGADMFVTLDRWHKADEIFKSARIAYVRRGNINLDEKINYFDNKYNADIISVDMPIVDISSTALRDMISKGDDVSMYIPQNVIEYIKANDLYGSNTQ